MGFSLNPFKKTKKVLVGTSTTDPQSIDPAKIPQGFPKKLLEKILLGTTSYVFEDENGNITKEEVLGVEETPLRQVLSRANTYGRFDLIDGDKRYAVVKISQNVLPIVAETPQSSERVIDINSEELKTLPVKR